MGVKSQLQEEMDAQGRPSSTESDDSTGSAEESVPEEVEAFLLDQYGPFVQNYEVEKFETDSETLDEMLTFVIAIGNVL